MAVSPLPRLRAPQVEGRLDGFVVVPLSATRFVLVYRNLRTKEAGARVGVVRRVEVKVPRMGGDEGEADEEAETEEKLTV
jgi:hypothetical protein